MTTKINIPVVSAVATLCGVALLLFFAQRHQTANSQRPADTVVTVEPPIDEIAYYNQLAGEYLASLPLDKRVLLTRIDSTHHHILYFETGNRPSCYCYDLETLITTVLFGGDNGFYAGTKLLIIGPVSDWRLIEDRVVFIAPNNAPGAEKPEAFVSFEMDLQTYAVSFLCQAAEISFVDDSRMRILTAKKMLKNIFTGENIYSTNERSFDLASRSLLPE